MTWAGIFLSGGGVLFIAAPVLAVIAWRVWSLERSVPRVQVPARVLARHPVGLFSVAFEPRYYYELDVEYPGPSGERLTARVKVGDSPTDFREDAFDGTVWVSRDDARDVATTPTGRRVRSFRLIVIAGICLAGGIGLLIYGGIEYVTTWFETNVAG